MPKVRRTKTKPPKGYELIEPTLTEFDEKMKEAVEEPHEGKRKTESLWKVHKVHYERNRYIYDLYYKNKQISKKLFDWLVDEKIADGNLIAKWRKPGYEKLCSLLAISKRGHNYGTTSICRIPLKDRPPDRRAPCVETGCISCCSSDFGTPIWWDAPVSLWKDVD
eukprot:TRINITY_DN8497_c0_g1_i1.p1 TRINITY_DN8497_c0_g1~~TRINITY_DN8497_c0_g1_i1.p1  ORF type:complete len:165 (-),score=30.44 TRINITY_DN8497_c0_g1_i1:191-685(-)